MRQAVFAGLCVAVVAVGGRADTYTLPAPKEPAKARLVKLEQASDTDLTITTDDGKMSEVTREKLKYEYTETVLASKDGKPTKFERDYKVAEKVAGGERAALAYQGRKVVFEKKGKGWEVTATPALEEADRKALLAEYKEEDAQARRAFYPDKAVKVGDRWDVGKEALAAWATAEAKVDLANSGGEAKLVKVTKKDGKTIGVVELEAKVAIETVKELTFSPAGVFTIKGTMEVVIEGGKPDAKVTTTGALVGKGTVKIMDTALKFALDSKVKNTLEEAEK